MQVFSPQGSKRDDLIDKLQTSIQSFQKEVSNTPSIHAESESVQQILHVFSNILEDGFEPDPESESYHYWSIITSVLNTTPMRFVSSLENFQAENEKSIAWILIELGNKSLSTALDDIVGNLQIIQHYNPTSLLRSQAVRLKEVISSLSKLEYKIECKFLNLYEENRDSFEQSDQESVVVKDDFSMSQSGGWTSTLYSRRQEGSLTTGDRSLGSSIQRSGSKEQQVDNTGQNNSEVKVGGNVNAIKGNLERYKTLLKRPTLNGRDEDESHTFVREEHRKNLEEKNHNHNNKLANAMGFITKVLEPVNAFVTEGSKKIMRKSSSYDKLPQRGDQLGIPGLGGGDKSPFKGSRLLDPSPSNNDPKRKHTRRSSVGFRPALHFDVHADLNPFDYNVRLTKAFSTVPKHLQQPEEENGENAAAVPVYRVSDLRYMKNSQLLYIQKYQKVQNQHEYRSPPSRVISAAEQEYKCFECGTGLNKILLKLWPRKIYCHYTGYWYCSSCMGKEKHVIPWYAKNNFDFANYHVSRRGREELKHLYDKPIISIEYKERVVLDNKALYDALVMKRQLHLIFDMICESPYVLDLLGTNSNLLLKQNQFSLKNLVEIHNGAMQRYLEKCFEMLAGHINQCIVCQNKGKLCPRCNNHEKIFPFDIKNTSVCKTCKYLYHTKCLHLKKCIVCQHN